MKNALILALLLVALPAFAEVDRLLWTVTTSATNAATNNATATLTKARGVLDSVTVVVPAATTGYVTVVVANEIGSGTTTLLNATNTTGTTTVYPTNSIGNRLLLIGETITLAVTNCAATHTNKTIKALIKFEK